MYDPSTFIRSRIRAGRLRSIMAWRTKVSRSKASPASLARISWTRSCKFSFSPSFLSALADNFHIKTPSAHYTGNRQPIGFYTIHYGCPAAEPTTSTPNPPHKIPDRQQAGFGLPSNCPTPPSEKSVFARRASPNSANLIGGGTDGQLGPSASASHEYVPFNGRGFTVGVPGSMWA
ncbi:hypothetical protein K438DRAFT_1954341 [Mycena galopus ATCC 62051]|nr:hypothetical protein K438DRAFT_1954341 [Mycena galopus ATCC 62051]